MGANQPISSSNEPLRISGRWLDNLSIPRKLGLIVLTFSLIVVALLSFGYFGLSILSDVRGYVGAEGLWSKAQKDAVYHLVRYVTFRDDRDFQAYQRDLTVPMGDRKARLELERARPDFSIIAAGLIEGRSHPQDVRGMAHLFRRYSFISFIRDAVATWTEGDRLLSDLIQLGDEVHRDAVAGTLTPKRQDMFLQQIDSIDRKLTPLEDRFSFTLGEGARWLNVRLLASMVILALATLFLGLLFAFRISRHLIGEIHALRDASNRVARGDFTRPIEVSSKDEIGELSARFGEMMTQRKNAEEQLLLRAAELNLANSRLVETERLKTEFFATVSHELRTPLTLVLSPIESLLSGDAGRLPLEQELLLKTMHNNATRLLQLVTGLLDFSKLEAGRMDVHHESLDLMAITKAVLSDFSPLMVEKELTSHLETSHDPIPVLVDRYLYERILFNLLSNAVKFTPRHGSVFIDLSWENGRARLKVRDTGIGISESDQKTLFQKFRQVEGASTRRFEGTGLGLALVREFAGLMGGSVTLESRPGQGSMFTVDFQAPAPKDGVVADWSTAARRVSLVQRYGAARAEESDATGDDSGAVPLPKVLVVEDNDEMAAYIASILVPQHRVKIARDGEEGLSLVHSWVPDLVLSDIMMPRKDGLALCREIKSSAKTSAIPVVLLTALTHREALLKGWEAGADDYLFKPFHSRELTTRVRSMLGNNLERRKIEERTHQLNAELERRVEERTRELSVLNAELEQFSFIAAHDLREPVRRIRIFGDLLKKEEKEHLTTEGMSFVSTMLSGADRLNDLIKALQAYSTIQGPQEEFEIVDLNTALGVALSDLEIRIRESGAVIKSERLPVITGHSAQLSQLFQNLISNAIKYRSQHVEPRISIRSILTDRGRVEILVEDNGIGINEMYFSQIFQPFKRLHTQREYEGVGMGLSICRKIVQRHGGQISVRSRVGEGSVFVLNFPAQSNNSEGASSLSA